jgi:hypothetical protein
MVIIVEGVFLIRACMTFIVLGVVIKAICPITICAIMLMIIVRILTLRGRHAPDSREHVHDCGGLAHNLVGMFQSMVRMIMIMVYVGGRITVSVITLMIMVSMAIFVVGTFLLRLSMIMIAEGTITISVMMLTIIVRVIIVVVGKFQFMVLMIIIMVCVVVNLVDTITICCSGS